MTDQTILTSEIIKSRDQYGRLLINQYLLLSELGKGQHGRVREAIDTETNERFAIKMVDRSPKKRLLGSKSRPSTAESSNLPQFRKPTDEKICKEIAILKKLHHENVVRLKEIIDDGASKTIYMILELMEGGEIQWKQQVYNDNGDTITIPTMSVNQARSTLTDVILGLEYLHYQGIIHRDIKPANLLWTGDHRVKISDFGVSHFSYALSAQSPDQSPLFTMSSTNKSETQLESSTPTSPNSPVSNASEEPLFTDQDLAKTAGSPAFFAPELCYQRSSQREGKRPRITNAIDVWALGVTLYCLLFGKVPFTAENEYALFNIIPIQAVEYPAYAGSDQLSLQDTEEGAQLRDLLDKLFEKDPTKRITLAQVKSHPWILRGIHEPSEWLKHTDVNASPAVQVTNEEVASALNFKSKIKRGWRTIADAFNAATGATGIPRRDSVNSSYNYNPYQQYPSQSELDVHSDDNNPYAPTSAIKQVYNRDREAVAAQPSQSPPQQQQRRMSVLERDSTVPTLAAPHPSHQPQSRLSRAASTSSQSSRPHGHIASDPSSRRQSIHHLHSNAPSTAQSPRSSLSNELGTSTHQHPFTSPTPIPMLRGNSDTCTLSNSGSTGEYDDQLLGGVSRSSAASPAASQSTSKRNSIRGFLKGLTLSNRKSSMSSNASNASTRFASFSEHREREKEERREREQKERQGREEREREIRKISHSSLSPTSSSHQRQPAMLAPPPRAPEYTDTYDDDVDIDVQLSGHSDSSDEDDDDEGARDRILSLSHSHSSNLRSSIIAIDDDSDDGAESSDISELHQPTQYWSNRGDGWRHVGAGEEAYDLTEESSHKIGQGNAGLGVGLAKSVSVGDSGDSASTSTGNDNSTPVPTPHKHSESDSSTPNKPGSIGVGVGNESTTDTASLATFKMRRDEASTQGEEREERVQDKDASQHYLQVGDARALHAPHLGHHHHHHHHHIDECAADSSSSDSEGDTLEITPRRSRNSSFAITSRSPSMSLSPTKLGQSGVLSAPPPQAPASGDK